MARPKLFAWRDAHSDEDPAFAAFWLAWPEEHRIAKGAARREWYKLRPTAEQAEHWTQAVIAQSQGRRWRAGYVPTPAGWLRDERWDDFVEPERRARPRCEHTPTCPNSSWHEVVLARERGEV